MVRCTVLLAVVVLCLTASRASAVAPPQFANGQGLTVTAVEQKTPRLFALTLTTAELTAPTRVWVLLPESYDASPARRYPVLYLFHGTSGGAPDWVQQGDAEATTAGRDLITVMPDMGVDGDGGGWFADWHNFGAGGPPRWETYHLGQLIPWVDANLRTRADRSGRAIAGLSQGGYGAFSYAARHPDTFVAAASYSGAIDSSLDPEAVPVFTGVVNATETALSNKPANVIFGDRAGNEINWAAHDPARLLGNLRGMRLFVYTGDGRLGPLDGPAPNPAGTAIEAGAHALTELFHEEAVRRSIPVEYHDYGAGTHTWPYWARDLRDTIGPLTALFEDPPAAPSAIDFTSDAATFSAWDWTVAMDRGVREFATLADAGRRGFTLSGSGTGTVTTPPVYAPGTTATVRLKGPATDAVERPRVGGDGRVSVRVPLGPSNAAQQFTAGADTRVRSTVVSIAAPSRASCAGRSVVLRLRRPANTRLRDLRATAAGRRLKVRRAAGRSVRAASTPRRAQAVRAAATSRGAAAARRPGRVVRVRVSLAGLPAGRVTVRVRARAVRGGRTVAVRRAARTLRVCG